MVTSRVGTEQVAEPNSMWFCSRRQKPRSYWVFDEEMRLRLRRKPWRRTMSRLSLVDGYGCPAQSA